MKSIRLSLLVYFLGLLALALGSVSFFAYQTTQHRLSEHRQQTEQLIQAQYEERCARRTGPAR